MQKKSPEIVFFGTEDFSLSSLKALVEAGFDVRLVVTKPDSAKGRGHKVTEPAVKAYALEQNIKVLQPNKVSEIIDEIKQLDEPLGVLVSFGKIIPESVIGLFTPGIINIHPSHLPKYRGPSPIESAILNRDETTGMSIMQISKEMDAGPVYKQIDYKLNGTETRIKLYEIMSELGSQLLVSTLPQIIDGTLQASPQDDSQASYCKLLTKSNGFLSPKLLTAEGAEAKVRAYAGFPKVKYCYDHHLVIINKSHVANEPVTVLDLECKDGKYLIIDELVAPSGRVMDAAAYLRGYKVS